MPKKKTIQRAQKDKEEGKAPSTQAGEFVREQMEKMQHHGRHAAQSPKSPKQAIAIGLSEARRHGINVPPRKRKR